MNAEPTISTARLAEIFNVTRCTIQKWIDKGMPIAKAATQGSHDGHRFDLDNCVTWYFAENFERLELDRARTRLANEQADAVRMANDTRSATLAGVSIIEGVLANLAGQARKVLFALPPRIAIEVADMDARRREAVIDFHIRAALEKLSAYRPKKTRDRMAPRRVAHADAPLLRAGAESSDRGGSSGF